MLWAVDAGVHVRAVAAAYFTCVITVCPRQARLTGGRGIVFSTCLLFRPSVPSSVIKLVNTIRYDTIRYDSGYLTCSKKLTDSQLSLPHRTNKKLKCETKNKMMSVIGRSSSVILWKRMNRLRCQLAQVVNGTKAWNGQLWGSEGQRSRSLEVEDRCGGLTEGGIIIDAMCRISVNQPTNQSINQSINQSTNQSTNQSISQSTNQSITSCLKSPKS